MSLLEHKVASRDIRAMAKRIAKELDSRSNDRRLIFNTREIHENAKNTDYSSTLVEIDTNIKLEIWYGFVYHPERLAYWVGFGSYEGNAITKLIENGAHPELGFSYTYRSEWRDQSYDDFAAFPPAYFYKPIYEKNNGAEWAGIAQVEGEEHFLRACVDYIEQVLLLLDHASDADDIATLRRRALASGSSRPDKKVGVRSYFQRSSDVRNYVLRRSNGNCEACFSRAPFLRPNGSYYLEPHHINRLTDGGPDEIHLVAACCPTCHRQIHYGIGGRDVNEKLRIAIAEKERNTDGTT